MYHWTSEAVSAGHPDKVADQIADAILDAHLDQDPTARVACEVVVTHDKEDLVILTGEITSGADVDYDKVVRDVLYRIGYDRPEHGFCNATVKIENHIRAQSVEIGDAVVKESGELGAGDQGLMFGYACRETMGYMPLAHTMSFSMIDFLELDMATKRSKTGDWGSAFRPDMKTQATIVYDENGPVRVDSLVVSVCHREGLTLEQVQANVMEFVPKIVGAEYFDKDTKYIINPSGTWNVGGPAADTGLSGRKIVVDNYGADCPIGGGSFSGKDPTKVDRSAAYMARFIAKNLVAGNFADKARVQLSYAIGKVEPVSVRVQTFGTGRCEDEKLTEAVVKEIGLSPQAIIDRFGLRTPKNFGGYQGTAHGGHFGKDYFPWEHIDTQLIDRLETHVPG
jgi:S-adenosylmethionine synthetase